MGTIEAKHQFESTQKTAVTTLRTSLDAVEKKLPVTVDFMRSSFHALTQYGEIFKTYNNLPHSPFEDVVRNPKIKKSPSLEVFFDQVESLSWKEKGRQLVRQDDTLMNRHLAVSKLYIALALSPYGFVQSPPDFIHLAIADTLFRRACARFNDYVNLYLEKNIKNLAFAKRYAQLKEFGIAIESLYMIPQKTWAGYAQTGDEKYRSLAQAEAEYYEKIVKVNLEYGLVVDPEESAYPRKILLSP